MHPPRAPHAWWVKWILKPEETEPRRPTPGRMCFQLNTAVQVAPAQVLMRTVLGMQPLLSRIFWCVSPQCKEPTFISALFVFPDPLALLITEVFSYIRCLIQWLPVGSEQWLSFRFSLVSLERRQEKWRPAREGLESWRRLDPKCVIQDVPGWPSPPAHGERDLPTQICSGSCSGLTLHSATSPPPHILSAPLKGR